jgi:hypothetical protein
MEVGWIIGDKGSTRIILAKYNMNGKKKELVQEPA